MPGKSIKGVLVEYGPGVASSATRIPSLLSSMQPFSKERSEVRSIMGRSLPIAPEQSFSEMPGDRHSVSENASKTEPAKLLAVFVVDTDEKELTTPLEK